MDINRRQKCREQHNGKPLIRVVGTRKTKTVEQKHALKRWVATEMRWNKRTNAAQSQSIHGMNWRCTKTRNKNNDDYYYYYDWSQLLTWTALRMMVRTTEDGKDRGKLWK